MDTETPTEIPVVDMTESPHRSSRSKKPNLVAAGRAIGLSVGGGVALLSDRSGTTIAASSRLPKLKLGSVGADGTMETRSAMMPYFTYKYTHSGPWPALATTGPVYKLVGPALDAAEAARLAAALGVDGTAQSNEQGWLITEGDRQVSISPSDGGLNVALYSNVGISVRGSDGSGSASVTVDAEPGEPTEGPPRTGGTTKEIASTDPILPDVTGRPEPMPEPEPVPLPKNLPSDSEAIKIAQGVIDAFGIDAAFEYETMNASITSVAGGCGATEDCAIDSVPNALYSRSILAHRLVDGNRVSGLTWSFDIGDNGVLQSAYGTIAGLEKLGDYPLRPVQSVYDDIVKGTVYGGQPMPLNAAAETRSTATEAPATPTDDIKVAQPQPSDVDAICLAKDCVAPEPDTTIEPVISTVNVTGVKIGSQVWYGFDGTTSTSYIVPMYSFSGTATATDNPGSQWTSDAIALDQSFIDTTNPPTPEPVPAPGDDGTKVTIEPGVSEPGVIEPDVSEPGVIEPGVSEPNAGEPGGGTEPGIDSGEREEIEPPTSTASVEP